MGQAGCIGNERAKVGKDLFLPSQAFSLVEETKSYRITGGSMIKRLQECFEMIEQELFLLNQDFRRGLVLGAQRKRRK